MSLLPDKFNFPIPHECLQLVSVSAKNWEAVNGILQCWERVNATNEWQKTGEEIPCVIGKKGAAWGNYENQHRKPAEVPLKQEGDMKAPAGLFRLKEAFGYAEKHINPEYPYIAIDENLIAVDDPKSKYYNQILSKNKVTEIDWNSSETMLREDGLYKYGLVIDYNLEPAIAGRGSCIYMHIWRGENMGTEGCTAMAEENLVKVLQWLNFECFPMLWLMPENNIK